MKSVPVSCFPAQPLVDTSTEARLTHARGQSTPEWVALCSGCVLVFPGWVALPTSEEQGCKPFEESYYGLDKRLAGSSLVGA
jgi:alkyldihydroxyacetonephosphate synthase